jgi:hypothetical protein
MQALALGKDVEEPLDTLVADADYMKEAAGPDLERFAELLPAGAGSAAPKKRKVHGVRRWEGRGLDIWENGL